MPKVYKPKEAEKILFALGFEQEKGRGTAYRHYSKPGYDKATITIYRRELYPNELKSLLNATKLTRKERDKLADGVL